MMGRVRDEDRTGNDPGFSGSCYAPRSWSYTGSGVDWDSSTGVIAVKMVHCTGLRLLQILEWVVFSR